MSDMVKAFIEAQSKFPRIIKGATGQDGHRTFLYADLPSIVDAVFPVLHENGFAITQFFRDGEIITRLMHVSGDAIESSILYPTEGVNPKELGKWITYLRRYAIVAILGVSPDDDDDADGVGIPKKKKKREDKPPDSLNIITTQGMEPPPEIMDDIDDLVSENYEILCNRLGKEKSIDWHKKVMENFFSGKKRSDLDKVGLAQLADLQNQRIKNIGGDDE